MSGYRNEYDCHDLQGPYCSVVPELKFRKINFLFKLVLLHKFVAKQDNVRYWIPMFAEISMNRNKVKLIEIGVLKDKSVKCCINLKKDNK